MPVSRHLIAATRLACAAAVLASTAGAWAQANFPMRPISVIKGPTRLEI